MSNNLDLKWVRDNVDKLRVQSLISDKEIVRADLERKTWWGGWRKIGSLLIPVEEAKAKIKECERKLSDAKALHEQKLEETKQLLILYNVHGVLYGDVESSKSNKEGDKSSSIEKAIKSVGSKDDKGKKDGPKPIISGQLKAVPKPNNQQNGKNRGGNNN